jgi:hypothetical protein
MSLTLEQTEKSLQIADIYASSKICGGVYIEPEDNLSDDDKLLTKIRINTEENYFMPYINDFKETNQTQRIYIAGITGCGKSTFMCSYILAFRKKYPKSKILFFSSKMKDALIDEYSFIERVKISDDMLENPYSLEEMTQNKGPILTCFDDIEDFPNKKLNKEVERLLNEILRNGR